MQDTTKIRNIAVLGHLGCGKTTLVESLYSITTGKPKGTVEKKNTISDYLPEEQNKLNSIRSSIVPINYKDYKFNLIDIPGSDDFIPEAVAALSVVKGAILVVDALGGIEVQTIKHWNMLRERKIPTFIYVNKLDKEGADFEGLLVNLRYKFGKNLCTFCIPMGKNDSFDGFVNIIDKKGRKFNEKTGLCEDCEIYDDKKAKVLECFNTMSEAVAETSEELLEKFMMEEPLTPEEIKTGLRTGVLASDIIPILVGSAQKNIGLHTMLDMFIDYLPAPCDLAPVVGADDNGNKVERKTNDSEPFSALVFKTIVDPYAGVTSIFKVNSGSIKVGDDYYISQLGRTEKVNALFTICGKTQTAVSELHAGDIGCVTKVDGLETSMTICAPKNIVTYPAINFPKPVYYKALLPKSKGDEDKLGQVLAKMMAEDKSLELKRNVETRQQLLGTLGLGHLNFVLERMKNAYKLDVATEDCKVVYRETIKGSVQNVEGRYVKQSGGSGFYGVVVMNFEPAPENNFTEEVFGGSVPKNYFPAVEKGFFEACEKGLLAGFPVIGVHGCLIDGKYHPVDSNELAFKMAGIQSFKAAYLKCKPVILEPIMKIVVTVTPDQIGDIISDLNTRRGRIQSMDDTSVTALVPESEILEYVNDLKSMTQGSGSFVREFNSYEQCPGDIQEKIIKEAQAAQAAQK